MTEAKRPSVWRRTRAILLWFVLPLLLGLLIAAQIPRPIVGVIQLAGDITPASAHSLIAQIAYARDNTQVRAVVLMLNSEGGTVVDSEAVYLELLRLRQTKPAVAVAEEVTASGAYYLASATDYIFAKPSSVVGSIGVISLLPTQPVLIEGVANTGPYKGWSTPPDTALREMEAIKQGFYQAVKLGRGSALRAGPEVLLSGQVWPGREALQLGLVDELGSHSQAIDKAAQMARISHYQATDLSEMARLPAISEKLPLFQSSAGASASSSRRPELYLLYVAPGERRQP